MDNLKPKVQGASFHWAVLPSTLGDKTTLQMISTEDIGWFTANAFLNPEQYLNKTLDIAGDEVTYANFTMLTNKCLMLTPENQC